MREDVEFLRNLTQFWYDFCVESETGNKELKDHRFKVWHAHVRGFQLTEEGFRNGTCIRLATAELPYTDAVRMKLWPNAAKFNRRYH